MAAHLITAILAKTKSSCSRLQKQTTTTFEPVQTPADLKSPFHLMVVGATASGKTRFVLNLLEKEYKNHFHFIYLICPTFQYNKEWQEWKYKDDPAFIVYPASHDNVNEALREIIKCSENTNSLIILDDCASGTEVKSRTSELVKLGFSGRHLGISTLVITQQYTSIAKPYREQISKIISFLPASDKDLKTLFDEYLSDEPKQSLAAIKKTLKTKKYARLEISLRIPQSFRIICPQSK